MDYRTYKGLDSTDWISNVIQILLGVISIIAPMIFAYWVSKKDTKEIDERQKRLEDNIKLLSEYQGKKVRCFNLTLFISKKVLQ